MFQATYTPNVIRKALYLYQKCNSFRKAAKLTNVSKSTIHRWHAAFHFLLGIRTRLQRKKKRPRKKKYPDLERQVENLFHGASSLHYCSLQDIRSALPDGQRPSLAWLHHVLHRVHISRRRFVTTKVCPKSENDLATLTKSFQRKLQEYDDAHVVCLDETGFSNLATSVYGYFTRGKQPLARWVPKRQKQSLLAAIHPTEGIIATALQERPFNKESFLAFLKFLLPVLPSTTKAILMDNVSFHKTTAVRDLLGCHGITPLFIPPYSPRCNPIEEVFSVLKRKFRTLNDGDFLRRVNTAITYVQNNCKELSPYYQHTRKHLMACCGS